jgi:hypothetical protein
MQRKKLISSANILKMIIPSNFACTKVWSSAFSIHATSNSIHITDWLQAWVEGVERLMDLRLSPSSLTNDVALVVTDVPLCVLNYLKAFYFYLKECDNPNTEAQNQSRKFMHVR